MKPSGLRQTETELWICFDGGGGQIGGGELGGGGLYCYTVQCRIVSNCVSTQRMTREEKERERMGIELNEQMGKMNITQLCRWVLLRF